MCGILGSVNYPLNLEEAKSLMVHRGPDAQTIWQDEDVSLVHFRLSIVDHVGGVQPMHLEDRYVVIFNGEIYNHIQLREKYKLSCKTSSDTETLLHLYHKLGSKCLEEMDAMYAMAIYDRVERKLFFARDKAGKKPLYIYQQNGSLLFASELNAIHHLLPNLAIDENALQKYLLNGSLVKRDTPYKNVLDFPAASFAYYDITKDKLDVTTWWSILDRYNQKSTDNYETAKEKIKEYFGNHVKNRMLSSDLEVGCFLSGGIDSGLATSFAASHTNQLKTFTVIFDGPFNEGPLAKQIAQKYSTNHTEIKIQFDDLTANIESILSGYGEPFFDSSAIPSWYVSREAKKHVTVILNGDGADELFGGYRRYVPFNNYDFFSSGNIKKVISTLGKALPNANNKKSIYNYLFRLTKLSSKEGIPLYLSSGVDIFSDFEYLLNFDTNAAWENEDSYVQNVLSKDISGLKKLMTLDFDINLFSDLLVKMDIATMAHSLEGRSPFLGKDLLDYVPSIKDSFKVNGKTTKFVLRDLAKDYLTPDLINQPKRGFEIPLKDWTQTILKDIMSDYLLNNNSYSSKFISRQNKEKLLNYSLNIPEEKCAKMLYTLFSLDVWAKSKLK